MDPKIQALEHTVLKYERTLQDLTVLNEELRTLEPTDRLADILLVNEQTIATSRRLLETARVRLEHERLHSRPPFVTGLERAAAEPA
jgi:hypothetical protein